MRLLSLLFIALIVQSCMFLGSHSRLVNQPTTRPVHVAVIVTQQYIASDGAISNENFLITKTMAEEFAKKKLFRFTILDRTYPVTAIDDLQLSLLGTELMNKYDAYLICMPRQRGLFNHEMELRLYQTRPTKELVRASHGTNFGNSYAWNPRLDQSLVDAIRGAIDTFEYRYKKIEF